MDKSNSTDVSINCDPLHLICPSCNETNEIEYGHLIKCSSCEKSFGGFSYKKYSKPFLSVPMAIIIGVYSGHKIDQKFFEPKRYSTAAIYEIVNSCSNPSRTLSHYEKKAIAKSCICALDKTMSVFAETELKENQQEFMDLFKVKYKDCN